MRVKIVFSLKNKGGTVPFHHQQLLAALVRDCLKGSAYEEYMYYALSGLKGQTCVGRFGLHYVSSKITLVVASLSQEWLDALVQAIFNRLEIRIGDLVLTPRHVEVPAAPVFQPEMRYVCLSPVVLLKASSPPEVAKRFVPPYCDAFSDYLYDAVMSRMEASGLYAPAQLAEFYKFQAVADGQYLRKIGSDAKKYARIYTITNSVERLEFRGYTVPFTLYAHEAVQEFVFACGLGHYAREGFGMLDMVE